MKEYSAVDLKMMMDKFVIMKINPPVFGNFYLKRAEIHEMVRGKDYSDWD